MDSTSETSQTFEKSKNIERRFLEQKSRGVSGLDLVLSLQSDLAKLYEDISMLLRKKICLSDYDELHRILNKWDSIYSYYGLDFGNIKIEKYRSYDPEFLAKNSFKKYIRGVVIKCGMHKTVTVLVQRKVTHHPTGKQIPRNTKYLVHDPYSSCKIGDEVLAYETRPISKRKNHAFFRKIYQ
ncbi:30S ribosomal protein S17 [Vreelandella neptunia]|uniref:30S ribosomal protein S17 n=1 Tax=Vreelandella neptunia TaxID=115551 RepID=A0ABZ0YRQ2_9GAMM|nr:30S ribosomal protein S17 [Halomonas neptunia]MDN3562655.1 30S ribosomal protein S17 [Halomonas neptunia]TDV94737.1 ribosomal protein S17 [Halomonas alkaliantarctica]WQH14849.1 30S ribosomal protein S17 [Halomonas neptunia]